MADLGDLERKLLESPSARARFLGDALELLEKQGVDTTAEQYRQLLEANLRDGAAFIRNLGAAGMVIAVALPTSGRNVELESGGPLVISSAGGRDLGTQIGGA